MINSLDEVYTLADDSDVGYFIDVDSENTDTIKLKTRFFCLYLDSKKVDRQISTNFSKKKLSRNYWPVKNFNVIRQMQWKSFAHYRIWKIYTENGMMLVKTNEVFETEQKNWLKTYTDVKTELKIKAENELQENLCRQMRKNFHSKNTVCEKKEKES